MGPTQSSGQGVCLKQTVLRSVELGQVVQLVFCQTVKQANIHRPIAPKAKVISLDLELCVKWMQQNLLVRKLRCINLSFLGAIFFLLNRGFSWSLGWHVCSGRMFKRYWTLWVFNL